MKLMFSENKSFYLFPTDPLILEPIPEKKITIMEAIAKTIKMIANGSEIDVRNEPKPFPVSTRIP